MGNSSSIDKEHQYYKYFDNYYFVKYEYYLNKALINTEDELHIIYKYLTLIKQKYETRNDFRKEEFDRGIPCHDNFDYSIMDIYIEKYDNFVNKLNMLDINLQNIK